MYPSIQQELAFKTSRSGGAGGQNVNKVETAVEGSWPIYDTQLFTEEQKTLLLEKLADKINKDGEVSIRSQVHRTQLANKAEVIIKFDALIAASLFVKKARKKSRPTKAMKERRLEKKKINSDKKQNRRNVSW